MKKSLLALAVLGAFAGVASAQSSVTLSGTLDVGVRYTKNDGRDRFLSMENSGNASSQLVFSGKEDLGGGLYAGFVLNSQLVPSSGNAGLGGKFFNRRETLSLWGNFGEIRLGRDYTPTFWNNTFYDPFGTVGVGDSSNVLQMPTGTFVRADSAISYFLPANIGGVYGQFMAATSERATTNPGRYIGGRIGFAAGPFDIAAAYATQRLDATVGQPSQKTMNIGGSYDLGVVKLMGYYDRDTLSYTGVDKKENRFSLGLAAPVGAGVIKANYDYSKLDNNITSTSSKITKFALGYVYNLSKRTAVYSTVARLSNDSAATAVGIGGNTGGNAALPPTPGGKSTAFEIGVRHFF
jgi:predicted porin